MVRKHQLENLNGFVLDLSFSVGSYQFFICYHIYLLLLQEIGQELYWKYISLQHLWIVHFYSTLAPSKPC